MSVTVVVGGFFGDEGKGKIVSHLVNDESYNYKIVARGGVGPNAGHTVVIKDMIYKLRMVPSGFAGKNIEKLLIGPGVLVDPQVLLNEIQITKTMGKIFCDYQCGIINKKHIEKDQTNSHLKDQVGTSGSGTGPANEDRVRRILPLARDVPELRGILTDVPLELHKALIEKKSILIEGTQATHLSLWHGTYPHVTSKDVTASAICSDVGIGPTSVTDVVLVFKTFVTRVGSIRAEKMENQLTEDETIKRGWIEYGTVTGRLRRAAPFNIPLAKRSIFLNGATKLALTKLDVVFPQDSGKKVFEDLSSLAKDWIIEKERHLGMQFSWIGTGPADSEIITRK